MFTTLLVIAYLIITITNIIFAFKEDTKEEALSESILIIIFSTIPFLQLLITLAMISTIVDKAEKRNKEELEKIEELKKLNEFIECQSCKIILRKGYWLNDKCPVCEEVSDMDFYDKPYIPSEDIYFQREITNIDSFKHDNLIQKTKEQNELYLSIMEKKLKEKK